MKKVTIISFIISLFVISCTKSNSELIRNNSNKPILIKIDAEHNDGKVISSPIILVR